MDEFKSCRICLKPTKATELKAIYGSEENFETQIFLLTGVQIVDMLSFNNPALICYRCTVKCKIAIQFRSSCIKSDQIFRRFTSENEVELWSNELELLNCGVKIKEEEEFEIPEMETKCEVIEDIFNENEEYTGYEYIAYEVDDPPYVDENLPVVSSPPKLKRPFKKRNRKPAATSVLDVPNQPEDSNRDPFQCKICGKKKTSIQAHRAHMHRHKMMDPKVGRPLQCTKCERQFISNRAIEQHYTFAHNIGTHICDLCSSRFETRTSFKEHIMDEVRIKNKERIARRFKCSKCGKCFRKADYLRNHELLHTFTVEFEKHTESNIEKTYKCELCEGILPTENKWRWHMKKHRLKGEVPVKPKVKIFSCKFCGRICPSSAALHMHHSEHRKANMLNNVDYFCFDCNGSFWSLNALRLHISRMHRTKSDFFCDVCGKSFKNKFLVKKHLIMKHFRTNKKIKQKDLKDEKLACSYCGVITSGLYSLKKHERIHTRTKIVHYYCDLCGCKFMEKTTLGCHIKFNHIKKRRYTCIYCPGKSWVCGGGLKLHMETVHLNLKHKCSLCEKEYDYMQSLRKHYRNKHNILK